MTRNYVRTTTRGSFTKDTMEAAIAAVLGGMSINKAAAEFDINYKTLQRYVKLYKDKGSIDSGTFGYASEKRRIFTDDQEQMIVQYILEASSIYYGLTLEDLRRLACDVAVKNDIPVPKSWIEKNAAGEDWLYGFRQRHQNISLRDPEATSLNRMQAFNKTNVAKFFNNLEHVIKAKKFTPECIWNVDETGCSTVQKPRRQLAMKGQKRVGSMVSQEKGCTVTLCGAINAVGNSAPPYLVFPRVNVQEHWEMTAPAGSKCDSHPKATGWMTSENFYRFLQHFERHARPSASRPVLLILDNHASHCSEVAITFCKENHITLLSFPPHCSHEMQPLDVSVYGPFQHYYDYAVEKWCKDPVNAGKQMSIHSVPQMVSYAYPKAFTPSNITAGFRATGIFPMDRNIFPDHKFLPTYSTDKPEPIVAVSTSSSDHHPTSTSSADPTYSTTTDRPDPIVAPSTSFSDHRPNQPSTSSTDRRTPGKSSNTREFVTPKELRPFPKVAARTEGKKQRKTGQSTIYTLTPEKRPGSSDQSVVVETDTPHKRRRLLYNSDSDDEANTALESILDSIEDDDYEVEEEDDFNEDRILSSSMSEEEVFSLKSEDFVFFRCEGKKSCFYYTGIIRKTLDEDGDFEVEYLKRSEKVKNKFVNFATEDIWSVSKKQIIMRLTKSDVAGTKRTKSGHIFSENIVKYAQ